MAEITAGMVRELREKTDAPMMECKKALTEAGGEMDKAEEILRVKLGNKASKAASRIAAEGVVAVHIATDGKLGAIIEINCETDFVAKNDDFLAFTAALAKLVAEQKPADVTALSGLPLDGTTVDERRKALVGKIGENVSIRRFVRMAAQGRLASYIHGGAKIGVLVDLAGGEDTLGKDIAMHIAATDPRWVDRTEVPEADLNKEREIIREMLMADPKNSGKPADILDKIIDGRLNKFYEDNVLVDQPFVKDPSKTVGELVAEKVGSIKENISIRRFSRFKMGEGIEKKADDFAAEVASMVG